jgi:DNA polymerase elongation subunit (family B)
MRFYTTVQQYGNNIFVRGYEHGKRFQRKIPYQPYLFVRGGNSVKSEFKTLDGHFVSKIQFEDIDSARRYVKNYEDVEGHTIYGLDRWIYPFINDFYPGKIEYDASLISVLSIDIETDSESGFPNIETADKAIISIAMKCRGNMTVLGLKPYTATDDVEYIHCSTEQVLLEKFLELWNSEKYSPDIVTGWNVEFFDMPYIVNRIRRILSDKHVKMLSPYNIMVVRKFSIAGRDYENEHPVGINVLDYLSLYKKFTFAQQESFKLDHIAFIELGEKKLDYYSLGYESLDDLYKRDHQTFIDYNIRDVLLVDKLDKKLGLLDQVYALAYDGKVNMIDTLTTVTMWDVIIHNYLLTQGTVIPMPKRSEKKRKIEGAYVKDPQVGKHDWVVSFDLNSLYPHLIMQYNISPDTLVHQIDRYANVEALDEQGELTDFRITDSIGMFIEDRELDKETIRKFLADNNCTITPTGCLFTKEKQGFLPKLMEAMYEDRSAWKKKMIEAKKQYEVTPSAALESEIARCHNMQLAKKIQLNSAYGALGNNFFRWFDPRIAESITKAGQLSIRWIEKKMNLYLNNLLKTESVDYVIACDTDSMYLNLGPLVTKFIGDLPVEKIVPKLDKVCSEKFEPFIDKCYEELAEYVNAYAQKMKMKREAIANKGIWTGKKHYILNVWNNEGVAYKEPKLKMMGIEAVKSSTPPACKESIKEALGIIMNQNQDDLIEYIENLRCKFNTLPFEEIAFPRSVKEMNKYYDPAMGYKKISRSGVPIHVRGALVFNHMIMKRKLQHLHQLIGDGDKIRYCYLLVPNHLQENVIATPGKLPTELNLNQFIDYDQQFQKGFLEPINAIAQVIGWQTERRASLEDFFA